MEEPVRYFLALTGFDLSEIRDYVIGEKYAGIMLNNGNIGVCAILDTKMSDDLMKGSTPDPESPSHRVMLNAWFNAKYNYEREYNNITDIFDGVDFRKQGKIVMVGYFETLFEKFRKTGIDISVFDIQKKNQLLMDKSLFEPEISHADTVILTGTTIFNNTFSDIIAHTKEGCRIFLLGPSNILSEEMFRYRNIRVVFGSVFEPFDHSLFRRIREGHGTRGFLENLKKVYLASEIN